MASSSLPPPTAPSPLLPPPAQPAAGPASHAARTAPEAEAELKHDHWAAEIELGGRCLKNLASEGAVLGGAPSRSLVGTEEALRVVSGLPWRAECLRV